MSNVKDEIKISCVSCEKEIYITKDSNNCPYCNYEFTDDMLAILFANITKFNINKTVNIPKVPELKKDVNHYTDTSIDIQCGCCGNYVSITSSAYVCPFCKGSFTPDAFATVSEFYKNGGSMCKITPKIRKSKFIGEFLGLFIQLLNNLGNLGCLIGVMMPFFVFLYFLIFVS